MDASKVPAMFAAERDRITAAGIFDLSGWKFTLGNARRTFGTCYYNRKLIRMSKPLCELNSEERVRETLLHELGHAVAGRNTGHSWAWREACRKIGLENPTRCYSTENTAIPEIQHGWALTCPTCGDVFKRKTKPAIHRKYYCRDCWKTKRIRSYLVLSQINNPAPVAAPKGPDSDIRSRVLGLRASGLGYAKIEAAMGWKDSHGSRAWRIVNKGAQS
jgi:predicted SprT family Zn-dependent metalloprotease